MDAGSPISKPIEKSRAALIDVGIGNIDSVAAVLRFLGLDFRFISCADDLADTTHIILPGVGAFKAGMAALDAHGLVLPLRDLAKQGTTRLLGICLGMQLLGERSEEGGCEGLGVMPFDVCRIQQPTFGAIKVPHVGFSTVSGYEPEGLFDGLGECADFYFTHSFAVHSLGREANIGQVCYGAELIAAFDAGSICGAQFHPEKSQSNGLQMLKNFFER